MTTKTFLEQRYDAVKSVIWSDAQDEYQNKQPFEFPNEIFELQTKPNRTFNFYPDVNAKQGDTVLKPSNAKETHDSSLPNVTENQKGTVLKPWKTKQIHNWTFDFSRITGNNYIHKTISLSITSWIGFLRQIFDGRFYKFYQSTLDIKIKKHFKISALLDSVSDSALVRKTLTVELKLLGN